MATVRLERTNNFLPIPGFSSAHIHSDIPEDPKTILLILQAAAHVKFHLLRQNPSRLINKKLPVEMFRVYPAIGRSNALHTAHGSNLLSGLESSKPIDPAEEPAHIHGKAPVPTDFRVDLPLEEDATYGMTLENKSHYDLFPFVFIFDLKTYEIARWYGPASRTAGATLKRVSLRADNPGQANYTHPCLFNRLQN